MPDSQMTNPMTGLKEFNFTIMLLGDSCTGKTCLLVRFKDNAFLANNFISTVGIDYRNKTMEVDGLKIKLQIWDTAGQERFRSVTHSYYRDADAILLVYDVTNKQSFLNVQNWLSELRAHASNNVVIILVGNKRDVANSARQVTLEDGQALANSQKVQHIETSAKTGHNVTLAFNMAAKALINQKECPNTNIVNGQKITLDSAENESSTLSYYNRYNCCAR